MKKNVFSIIIPTTTIPPILIDETLPSINAQSNHHFECIIVPDKVNKESKSLEKKYSWLKIIPSHHEKKPGIKRDLGAKKAKGSILVFIDDDVFVPKNWLKHADELFKKYPKEVALGGPGIIVNTNSFWENISNAVLQTPLGSGKLVYRFRKDHPRHVDDYPTMNLFMRTEIFKEIGGFQTNYWPGEDSKLVNELMSYTKRSVYYHPKIWVHHHRRSSLIKHISQHANYGKMRGTFAAQGDKNSSHLVFIIPSLFTIYCFSLIFFPAMFTNITLIILYFFPLILYVLFASWESLKYFIASGNLVITFFMLLMFPLTHLTYGISHLSGFLREKFSGTIHI